MQENFLNKTKLQLLTSLDNSDLLDKLPKRPEASFKELMDWTKNNFYSFVNKNAKLQDCNLFVHNIITIDNNFLSYCELNNLTIKCLYKDAMISWANKEKNEEFFAQGVYLIKSKDTSFISAALYHKGNQNEDEISFFILVDNSNYESYIKLRNAYSAWLLDQDKNNLFIKVIDGDDIPYTKDISWNDVFLEENVKKEIINSVEGFLNNKSFYIENNIPWKKGILLHGPPGNGKTSSIRAIMANYPFKPITIIPEGNIETVRDAFDYAKTQSPALLFFEDLDSLLENNIDLSGFLNLLDGTASANGLFVIATANNISKMKASVIDRPSRFDRKIFVKCPETALCSKYLKSLFKNNITTEKLKEISTISFKNNFSYAYLKELYISSMFEAISNNRKKPTNKDIDTALKILLKDKLSISNKIQLDNYFN